jgi:hypothetical protein
MRKIAIVLAAVAMTVTTFGGVASANNGGGGKYPPNPVVIIVQNPTVPYGDGFWAKGKGLCAGGDAFFAIQSVDDPTKVFFTGLIPVNPDGTVSYTFTPEDLAGFVGQITVFVKQRDICNLTASTIVTIVKDKPGKSPSVSVKPSTVKLGDDFTAKAKNLCKGTVIFAVQSTSDWTVRFFSPPVPVGQDGTASYTFDASDLPGGAGDYTVYAKQPECNIVVTTVITVKDQRRNDDRNDDDENDERNDDNDDRRNNQQQSEAVVVVDTPNDGDNGGTEGSGTTATEEDEESTPTVESKTVTPQVLSAGLTAPTSASTTSGTTAQVASSAASTASGTLPVTGSEPSRTLQIALTALVGGLGMIAVASMRRRTANVRSR